MQTRFLELTDSQWQVIENKFKNHRPNKHSLRVMLNALFWIVRTGTQWRNLDSKYPCWQSVYYYFRIWSKSGLLEEINLELVKLERKRLKRDEDFSVLAVDSQSVKAAPFIWESKGIDGAKKVNGRKRPIMVDSQGLLVLAHVSGANAHDSKEGMELLWQLEGKAPKLKIIRGDKPYGGDFKNFAKQAFGWQVETTQRPPSAEGFIPEAGRWQVERSFAWLNSFRRLSKSYERLAVSEKAMITLAFIAIILNRIT